MTTRTSAVQINSCVDALALWNLGWKNLLLCNDCGKNILIHHPCEAVLWNQAFFRQQKKKTKTEGSIDYVILQRRNFRQVPFVLKYYIKMFMTRLFCWKSPNAKISPIRFEAGCKRWYRKKCHTHRSKGSRQRLCGGGGKISDKRFSGFCFLQQKITEEKQVQLNQKQPKETFWWGHHYLSIRLEEETRLIVFPLLCDTITGAV